MYPTACRLAGTPRRAPRADADTWTLGAIALFRPRKGIEVLLEALAALRSRGRELAAARGRQL